MSKTVGRPRSAAADDAIFFAAKKLFYLQAYEQVSMQMIASEAKVSKATLYRRWSNKSLLAIEILIQLVMEKREDFLVRAGYRARLVSNLKGLRDLLSGPYADVVASLIASGQQDASLRHSFIESFLRPVQTIGDQDLAQAVADGEILSPVDQDLLFDQMFGLFYYRLLIADRSISDHDIERVVSIFLGQSEASAS
ncbi:MAG: TetR/AcrR family transcriptional regulator [Pseudomonadales bacterium]|nr:TetR/AcrR family transcriptional regulator [Pseudomonadales bacterium]